MAGEATSTAHPSTRFFRLVVGLVGRARDTHRRCDARARPFAFGALRLLAGALDVALRVAPEDAYRVQREAEAPPGDDPEHPWVRRRHVVHEEEERDDQRVDERVRAKAAHP